MKRTFSIILVLALALSLSVSALAADSSVGDTLRLTETVGAVTVKTSAGQSKSVIKDMRLYNGYTIETGKEGAAFINLGDGKAVRLDSSGKMEVKSGGQKLEVSLFTGQVFFSVTQPIKAGEELILRTAAMVASVRGGYGIMSPLAFILLHGSASVVTKDGTARTLTGGQVLFADGTQRPVTNDDVPAFAAEEIAKDLKLQAELTANVATVDVPSLIDGLSAKQNAEKAAKAAEQKKLDDEAAAQRRKIDGSPTKTDPNATLPGMPEPEQPTKPTMIPYPAIGGGEYDNDGSSQTINYTVTLMDGATVLATFKVDDGTVIDPADTRLQLTNTVNGTAVKAWYSDVGRNTLFDFTASVTTDTSLYVEWEAKMYDVTFQSYMLSSDTSNAQYYFSVPSSAGTPATATVEGVGDLSRYAVEEGSSFAFSILFKDGYVVSKGNPSSTFSIRTDENHSFEDHATLTSMTRIDMSFQNVTENLDLANLSVADFCIYTVFDTSAASLTVGNDARVALTGNYTATGGTIASGAVLLLTPGVTLTVERELTNSGRIAVDAGATLYVGEGASIVKGGGLSASDIQNLGTIINEGGGTDCNVYNTEGGNGKLYSSVVFGGNANRPTPEPLNLALVFAQNAAPGSFSAITNSNGVVERNETLQTTFTSDTFSSSYPCVATYLYKKADGTCVGFRKFNDNPLPQSCVRLAGQQPSQSIGYGNDALIFGNSVSYKVSDGAKIVVVIYDSAGGNILDDIDAALPAGNKLKNKSTSLPHNTGGSLQGAMAVFDKTQLTALVNEMSTKTYNFGLRGAQNADGQLTAAILDFTP